MAKEKSCNFCGGAAHSRQLMVDGPGGVTICNQCIEAAQQIWQQEELARKKGKVKAYHSANQERSSNGTFSAVTCDNSDKSPTNEQVSLYGVQIGVNEDPNEVQQRHFSKRFTSHRFSIAELHERRSNQVAVRLTSSPKRQRTSGEFAEKRNGIRGYTRVSTIAIPNVG